MLQVYNQHFHKQHKAKISKKSSKAKQHPEARPLLSEK